MAVRGGDPALAEHPIGVLCALRQLDHENEARNRAMYDAAISFTTLWLTVYPRAFPISTLSQFVPGGVANPPEDAEFALQHAINHIGQRGCVDAVVNACVYRRMNPRNLEKLRTGLRRLTTRRRPMREAA